LASHPAAGDPRLSPEERYGTQVGYICAVTKVAKQEVARRFPGSEDADRLVPEASAVDNLPGIPSTLERQVGESALPALGASATGKRRVACVPNEREFIDV
jgi:hypothetical protein